MGSEIKFFVNKTLKPYYMKKKLSFIFCLLGCTTMNGLIEKRCRLFYSLASRDLLAHALIYDEKFLFVVFELYDNLCFTAKLRIVWLLKNSNKV